MGLDITAYRKIEEVRKPQGDDDGYSEGLTQFYIVKNFRRAADDVKEKMLYRPADAFGFRAGSYSGYNRWREWLASLVGTSPSQLWNDPKPGPFMELINFSDCEGVIGPRTAKKLAQDFATYDEKAKAADHNDGYDYGRYCDWRKAMEMAADDGAVSFH